MSRLLVVALLAACERHRPPPAREVPGPVASEPPAPPPPSLAGAEGLVPLAVPGFSDAVVSLPLGTIRRRPIVVACHGNYDRPEWQCATWRSVLNERAQAFVLCPRGIPRPDSPSADDPRFTYASADALAKELDAAIAALRAAYPDFVDPGPMIYTGFSLGAIYGVSYVLRDPSRFPRLVLTEGSHGHWTSSAVNAFAKKGGERVLFACGQPSCVTMANTVANVMKKVSVDARVVHGKGVGHGYTGPVADEIQTVLPWLIDDRFKE